MDETDPADPYSSPGQEVAAITAARTAMQQLAAAGMTDAEIAAELKVSVKLVRASGVTRVPFTKEHDDRVARALFEAAVGGRVTWRERLDKDGIKHRLREEIPPDAKAALAWAERRDPEHWGEKRAPAVAVVLLDPDALLAKRQAKLEQQAQLPAIEHQPVADDIILPDAIA